MKGNLIRIVYGTQSGNTMALADEVEEKIAEMGFETKVEDTEDLDVDDLPKIEVLLLLMSTEFDGNPPLMAEELLEYLQSDRAPDLRNLSYTVLALGDTLYDEYFCMAGINFDEALERLGAKRIVPRVDCDADYEEGYELWVGKVMETLKKMKED